MYGFGSDNEIWTSVGHPIGDLIIEMACEMDNGNVYHQKMMKQANEILEKTDWEALIKVKSSEEKTVDSDLISDEEFAKAALLKAGHLAIAAKAILMARATQLGDAIKQLDKVLSDYDDFIMKRVNDKHKVS
jgi:hypothetical protein